MQASSSKECRLNIRCNGHARELLDRAASYTRLTGEGPGFNPSSGFNNEIGLSCTLSVR